MARSISVLYQDKNGDAHEHHFGTESTEPKARNFAWTLVAEACTNVVLRCTYPDTNQKHVTHTAWAEVITNESTPDYTDPTTKTRECLDDLLTYTIPGILLEIDRAYLRGDNLTPEWFIAQLQTIEHEMSAAL